MRLRVASVLVIAALALGGCIMEDKEGSGVEASETREVEAFTAISLTGTVDVVVTVGEAQEVTVRGDDNLLEDVVTTVDNGTLEVAQTDRVDLKPKVGITVEISVPELESVDVSGVADVTVEGVQGDLFKAEISGAGNVEATGEVDRVEADVSGAGDLRLDELVAREAVADVSGAGDIHIHATESLDASVSGAGDIIYSGDPDDVEEDVSGAGEIKAE